MKGDKMNAKHEQSIAEKVKAYNEKLKSGETNTPAPKTTGPVFSGTALSTWQNPVTQVWYLIEIEYDPFAKEARFKSMEVKEAGKPEAREEFKIKAAKLGLV